MPGFSDGPQTARGGTPSAWLWSQYRGESGTGETPQTAAPGAASTTPPPETADADTARADAGVGPKGNMAGPLVALVFVVTGIIFYAAWPTPKPPATSGSAETGAPEPKAEIAPKVEPAPAPAVQAVPPAPPAAAPAPADRGAAARPAHGKKQKKPRKAHD